LVPALFDQQVFLLRLIRLQPVRWRQRQLGQFGRGTPRLALKCTRFAMDQTA